jgi:hypothetical protein
MIHGGKTLWPYAYHDLNDRAALYEGIRYLFSTFEALEDMVLLAKRTELIYNQNVHAVHYALNGEEMFVLVNLVDEPQTVTLDGISGSWYNFRHGGMITGNTFDLKPYEVVIGTSKIRDEGLPTYQEEKALVDKLEYERTHTGNLLFDRHDKIGITSSSTIYPDVPKLFDGVRDNLGYELHLRQDQTENIFEMDLTQVAPSFNKVAVHGLNVDGMTIQLRICNELVNVEAEDVITGQYSTTILLKETVKPDGLRLIFPKEKVELYEIEVF